MKDLHLHQTATFKRVGVDLENIIVDDKDATVLKIAGYASVFANEDGSRYVDRDGESVSVSNLDVEEYLKNPILVYNHDWSDTLGTVTNISKDYKGLYIEAEIHKLTGRESVFESVQKGIVKTFSIGFIPKAYTYLEDSDVLEISEASLIEISLAPVPASGEALFQVTGQKSLSMNAKEVASQNDMSLCELKGLCGITKKPKGIEMEVKNKEPEVKVEPVVKVEPKVEPEVKVEPQEVNIKVDAPTADDLAERMVEAQLKAEAIKAEQDEKAAQDLKEAEEQKKAEEKARVDGAIAYITETTDAFVNTPTSDIDPDAIDDFYELITNSVDKIEGKIVEVVTEQVKEA